MDPDDLAAQVVGVAGGAASVLERQALVVLGPVVPGVTRPGAAGGVVVTGTDVEVALVVEGHASTRVAAAVDLGVPLQQVLTGRLVDRLGLEVVGEPRDRPLADPQVPVDRLVRHPVDVDPAVLLELGVGDDAEEAFLVLDQLVTAAAVAHHGERGEQLDLLGLRVPLVDRATAEADLGVVPAGDRAGRAGRPANVEDLAVGGDGQAVRLADLVELTRLVRRGQPLGHIVRRDGRLAVTADQAGRPLDGAAEVALELLVAGVARLGATHAGVERPAAVVVTAPRDRVERAVAVQTRLVEPLLELRDRVDLAERVGRPVHPLVGPLDGERHPLVGRVLAVGEVDLSLLHLGLRRRAGLGAEQPQLGQLGQRLTAVRGDVQLVPQVCRAVLELEFPGLEPLREGLIGPLVQVDPGLPVLRALQRPVLRVTAVVVVGRGQRVVSDHDRLLRPHLGPPGVHAGQPLGVVVAVDQLGLALARRVLPADPDLDDLLGRGDAAGGAGADQVGEPGRVRLCANRIVDADETAAVPDERLERGLLCGVQGHALGGQEHHAAVARQVLGGEDRRVLGHVDAEAARLAQVLDRRRSALDWVVLLCRRTMEHQHVDRGVGGLRRVAVLGVRRVAGFGRRRRGGQRRHSQRQGGTRHHDQCAAPGGWSGLCEEVSLTHRSLLCGGCTTATFG